MRWFRPSIKVICCTNCCAVGLLSAFLQPVHAATLNDPQTEVRRVEQRRGPIDPGGKAVRASRQLRFIGGRDVTYDEVLRDPDNMAVNLAFARTQIRDGDFIGASATLERILLIEPTNIDVLILYAIVLYRLDNLNEAERELSRVLTLPLSEDLRAELSDYLKEIKRRKQRDTFAVTTQHAYVYDTNRNSSPSSGALDTEFGRVRLFGSDRRVPDSSYQGQISVDWEHDLGFQRQHRLVSSVRAIHSDQSRLDQLTLSSTDGRVGLLLDYSPYTIEPFVTASYALLSHQQYYRSVGVGVRGSALLTNKLRLSLFGTAVAQNYDGLSEAPDERQRSGAEYQAGASLSFGFRADMRLGLSARLVRKTAVEGFFAYSGTRVRLEHEYLLGRGIFLLSQLGWEFEQYDDPKRTESAMTRRQHRFRGGSTIGVPMSLVVPFKEVYGITRRTTLVAAVDYTRDSSNITNYSSSNWRFMVGVTIRVER